MCGHRMWADELAEFTAADFENIRRHFTHGDPQPSYVHAVTGETLNLREVVYTVPALAREVYDEIIAHATDWDEAWNRYEEALAAQWAPLPEELRASPLYTPPAKLDREALLQLIPDSSLAERLYRQEAG
jgi:hypothetical protein